MTSQPAPHKPVATKAQGPHHNITNDVLRLLDEGPPEGLTAIQLTALSVYGLSSIRQGLQEGCRAGLLEVSGTRPTRTPGGSPEKVWRRNPAAGQP